jgi:uncharacterized protein (TIGR03000 family)
LYTYNNAYNTWAYPGTYYSYPSYYYPNNAYSNYAYPGTTTWSQPYYGSTDSLSRPLGNSTASTGRQQSYQSYYSGPNAQSDTAYVRVVVPDPDAKLTIQGEEMKQKGTDRVFVTPPLETGWNYSYNIKANWKENGRDVSQEQHVTVKRGQETVVQFKPEQGSSSSARNGEDRKSR